MTKQEKLNELIEDKREDLEEHYNYFGMGWEDEDEMFYYNWMYEISDKDLIEDYGSEEMQELFKELNN